MSFLRHGEIYHFDEGATPRDHAIAHRNCEFAAGYSLAGSTPREPASASPAAGHLAEIPVRSTIEIPMNGKQCLNCLSHLRGQPPLASKPRSSSWIFRLSSRRCIPVISCQFRRTAHLTSNSTWTGLSGETDIVSPSESDPFLKSHMVTIRIVHSFVFGKKNQGALHFFVLSQLMIVFC